MLDQAIRQSLEANPKAFMAYWTNGLGEECSSRVRAYFTDAAGEYLVVWSARRRELIVMPVSDFNLIRRETF